MHRTLDLSLSCSTSHPHLAHTHSLPRQSFSRSHTHTRICTDTLLGPRSSLLRPAYNDLRSARRLRLRTLDDDPLTSHTSPATSFVFAHPYLTLPSSLMLRIHSSLSSCFVISCRTSQLQRCGEVRSFRRAAGFSRRMITRQTLDRPLNSARGVFDKAVQEAAGSHTRKR